MKKRLLSVFLLACTLCAPLAGCRSGADAANEARGGVVRVLSYYGDCTTYLLDTDTDEMVELSAGVTKLTSGSAFGVGDAGKETTYFVTNRHVVGTYTGVEDWNEIIQGVLEAGDEDTAEALRTIHAQFPSVILYTTGKLTGAYILKDDYAYTDGIGLDTSRAVPCDVLFEGGDSDPDLAVLRAAETIPGRVALPLLAEGREVSSGDTVYALGYPGSTDAVNTTYAGSVDKVTITNGIVSLHSNLLDDNGTKTDIVQHTAQINHGNSGGPLIDENGAVAGVNTWGWGQDDSNGNDNSYGSIEIYYVRDRLDALHIDYDVYSGGLSPVVIAVIAVLAAALVIALVLVLRKKKTPVKPPAQGMDDTDKIAVGVGAGAAPVGATSCSPQIPDDSGLRVQGLTGQFAGRRFAIPGQIRIGRDPARNDLVYPAGTQGVSGVHCVVIAEGDHVLLKDLGSTYGTFVDGSRLASSETVTLHVGDRFYLGSEREAFVITRKGEV